MTTGSCPGTAGAIDWDSMTTILLRGGRVHTSADPDATALAITDGLISWIGGEHGLAAAGTPDRVVDLDGRFVAPGFVDAHVHATDAGLALTGLDLRPAGSLDECLALVARAAGQGAGVIWGHGWDETRWPERRWPSRAEVDAVTGNRPAYLTRVDVHSAVANTALAVATGPELPGLSGWSDTGPLTRDAHHAVRAYAKSLLTGSQRTAAQRAFLVHAASRGIVEVHECGFPGPQGLADFTSLLSLEAPISVLGYLAALATDEEQARGLMTATGARGLAGDLSVDGALGSRTAALHDPYLDGNGCGARYLTDSQIAVHLEVCARAGIQPGFHAIGDQAVDAVARGLRRAAEQLGPNGTVALAAVTPRVEHAEMPDPDGIAAMAATGTIASVQPLFDAEWGGRDGMYAQRLGVERAAPMNPFARFAAAGVPLAFGSDAPVTDADPWRAVQAAVHHRSPGSGISPRAAFTAHTRGGHRSAGRVDRGVGTISIGAPAHLVIYEAGRLVRPEADPSVARWSTDPRSRVPLLPDLTPGNELPVPVATIVAGEVVADRGLFT